MIDFYSDLVKNNVNTSSGGTAEARSQAQAYCDPQVLVSGRVVFYGGQQPRTLSSRFPSATTKFQIDRGIEDDETAAWETLKQALDEDRLSDRKLFP